MNRIKSVSRNKDGNYVVTEEGGAIRVIPPLYFPWMVDKGKGKWSGRFFYNKDVPENFFEKKKILEENGWWQGYAYDHWVNKDTKRPEYCGLKTDEALNRINES